jgi:hypothetical protein
VGVCREVLGEGKGAAGGRQLARHAYVVLDKHGNAVKGSWQSEVTIEALCVSERVGVHGDDRAEGRAVLIDLLDPGKVLLGDGVGGLFALLHRLAQVGDGGFVELERTDLTDSGGGWFLPPRLSPCSQQGSRSAKDPCLQKIASLHALDWHRRRLGG